jgi:molecular chaperone DnaK (HSP70)
MVLDWGESLGREGFQVMSPDAMNACGCGTLASAVAAPAVAAPMETSPQAAPTRLSIGIESLGGIVIRIIPRDIATPISAAAYFTTAMDGQSAIAFHVVEGERELAKDCRSLARLELNGIPAMAAGLARLEVRFAIDAGGTLRVSARDQHSGREAHAEATLAHGLTDDEIEGLVLDGFDAAEEDFRARQLIEARNEAQSALSAVEKARRGEAWLKLTSEECARIQRLEQELLVLQNAARFELIMAKIAELNQATLRLAVLTMDAAAAAALVGKTIEQAEVELDKGASAGNE